MLIKSATSAPTSTEPGAGMLVILVPDNWNDWYAWKTMFSVHVYTGDGNHHHLGSVKIGEKGAVGTEESPYRPEISGEGIDSLGENFISVGQDENYYTTLKGLSDKDRDSFLIALRDCAYRPEILDEFEDEEVVKTSILRSVTKKSVFGRYNRIANGNAALTRYNFTYNLPFGEGKNADNLPLKFEVSPDSKPPTNVHVLIGRNAVGKTRALNLMVRALISDEHEELVGSFEYDTPPLPIDWISTSDGSAFSGVASVSFSAFDRFGPHGITKDGLAYSYVGLKKAGDSKADPNDELPLKDLGELANEFALSAEACRVGRRSQAWQKALTTLESDPLFEEFNIRSLATTKKNQNQGNDRTFFKSLSSGHGIVLLIVTRLVELVEEQTLVLIDEPETHLHPPLLSAFIRSISSLLIDRNGVAIIATHSPVVLQEVPRHCVWKIDRAGLHLKGERPEIETFGENVGTLTREVFGLEVTKSGFHDLLSREVESDFATYESVVEDFSESLGAEARSLLRSMLKNKNSQD